MDHPWRNADWDSIRLFVTVSEKRSFRQASETTGIPIKRLRQGIARLEDQLGFRLFHRETEGVSLTHEGRRLAHAARDVDRSVNDLWRVAEATATTKGAPIRVAVTEGLGSFWLTPRLVDYIEKTDSRIELQCAMRSVDVLRLEADISIQFTEPDRPELICKKMGNLHLFPFASPEYIERFGAPKAFAELAQHRIVEQETDQLGGYKIDELFSPEVRYRVVRMKTNFSSAHYLAISRGAGIGLLPNYAQAIGGHVDPVDLNFCFSPSIWLAAHPEILKAEHHRRFVDWLSGCFSYPWFKAAPMAPANISGHPEIVNLARYFDGFVGRSRGRAA
jgi:DNA-binding transcriptional LysR family regulator